LGGGRGDKGIKLGVKKEKANHISRGGKVRQDWLWDGDKQGGFQGGGGRQPRRIQSVRKKKKKSLSKKKKGKGKRKKKEIQKKIGVKGKIDSAWRATPKETCTQKTKKKKVPVIEQRKKWPLKSTCERRGGKTAQAASEKKGEGQDKVCTKTKKKDEV